MPALINCHTHLYSTLARGIPLPGRPPANFPAILKKLWWRLDRALNEEDVYYSALVGLIDSAKSGVGTLIDHHSSPHACAGSLDRIEQAFREVGLRGATCYEISDRNGRASAQAGIDENVRFIERARPDSLVSSRVRPARRIHPERPHAARLSGSEPVAPKAPLSHPRGGRSHRPVGRPAPRRTRHPRRAHPCGTLHPCDRRGEEVARQAGGQRGPQPAIELQQRGGHCRSSGPGPPRRAGGPRFRRLLPADVGRIQDRLPPAESSGERSARSVCRSLCGGVRE